MGIAVDDAITGNRYDVLPLLAVSKLIACQHTSPGACVCSVHCAADLLLLVDGDSFTAWIKNIPRLHRLLQHNALYRADNVPGEFWLSRYL